MANALVPQQPSHEDEHRTVTLQSKFGAEVGCVLGVGFSAGEVNAVFHDADTMVIVFLVAEVDEVLARALAYRPNLVRTGDIGDEHFDSLVLH